MTTENFDDFEKFENPNYGKVEDHGDAEPKEVSLQPKAEVETKSSAMVMIEQSRAVQEVQAALVIAKRFPRDHATVYTRIMTACKRHVLASKAMYAYPRAGQTITGPSIRLAEVMAQNYGNLDFGIREIERRNGVSIAESYCWDMETNTRQTKVFEVPHEMQLKNKTKKVLTDPRDIYEIVANNGARRLRACILGIIPVDIVDAAVNQCKATLIKGNGQTLEDRVRAIVLAFKDAGVSQEMLEKKLGHKIELTTAEEVVELTAIGVSLRDKQAKRSDFFDYPDEEVKANAETVINKLKGKS